MFWMFFFQVAMAAPPDLISTYAELRDLNVFVRAPDSCHLDPKWTASLGEAVRNQQDNRTSALAGLKLKRSDIQWLRAKVLSCRIECGCSALSSMIEALQSPKLKDLIIQCNHLESKMTDQDYIACENKAKPNCSRPSIQEAMTMAKENSL